MRKASLISRLRSIDWDFFGSQSHSPFASIHWHPGVFVSQIPATLIGLLTKPGDTVLDPFVGSGTTLVEAQRLGRASIGIDLNPASCQLTRAKVLQVRAATVHRHIMRLRRETEGLFPGQLVFGREPSLDRHMAPAQVQLEKWYSPRVQQDLVKLRGSIERHRGTPEVLAKAVFSSILLTVCRETRHWGYICDNTRPLGHKDIDVQRCFLKALGRFEQAYLSRDRELQTRFGQHFDVASAEVYCSDALEALRSLPSSSIDLVITSPPYFGVVDYTKCQRLTYEWFGWDIEEHRQQEIGARSKRHRRQALEQYLGELTEVLGELRRVTRRNGWLVMVLGQSESRQPVLQKVRNAAARCRWDLSLDLNRTVASQRRQAPSLSGEHMLFLS